MRYEHFVGWLNHQLDAGCVVAIDGGRGGLKLIDANGYGRRVERAHARGENVRAMWLAYQSDTRGAETQEREAAERAAGWDPNP